MTVKIDAEIYSSQTSKINKSLSVSVSKKIYQICSYGIQEIRPDADYHPDYPASTYISKLVDNSLMLWLEGHEYDLQYETTQCHSLTVYKVGYQDDNGTFHEFSNYKIYKNSNLTGEIKLSTCEIGVLNSSSASDDDFPWDSGTTHRSAKVYIIVNDDGYQGTYIGRCEKYNYL